MSARKLGLKKLRQIVFAALLVLSCTCPVFALDMQVQSGLQYDWWGDNEDREASQLYVPLTVGAWYENYSVKLLAGYADTHVDLADGRSDTLSAALDTKLVLSYEVPGDLPADVLIGLDFNLPTGKTNFEKEELIIIMDPDLVSITTFGEGFNVNPTINVVKNWGDIVAGMGIGFLWRGKYDFSENTNDYDPGDIINASIEVGYTFLTEWNARAFGYYAHYGKDKVEGEEFAQEGNHYMFGLGLNYDHIEWEAGAIARGIFRDKNKLQETAGGLFTEDNNSQGNEWIGDLYMRYDLDGTTTLKSSLQGLYIEENDYPSHDARFTGKRKKATLGLGIARQFDNDVRGEFNVKGFLMRDAQTNFPEPRDSTTYQGLSAVVLVSKGF